MAHAPLSPSAAHRWLVCPASVKESKSTVSVDSDASKEGTATHEVGYIWLTTGHPPAVGTQTSNGLTVTEEMVETAEWFVRYVLHIADEDGCPEAPSVVMAEEKVAIGGFFGLDPSICFGTADAAVLGTDTLTIVDLKAGYKDVVAEQNPQTALYGLGFMEEMGWMYQRVRLAIVQPRNGGVKEWVLTKAELLAWGDKHRQAVAEAAAEVERYQPTEEGCRYCPAAGVCKAAQAEALALARREFDDPEAVVTRLSPEELSLLLSKVDLIDAVLKAAKEHALRLISVGHPIPGWKAVAGRKNRVWKDEGTIGSTLGLLGFDLDDVAPRKLISPAKAEALVGKKLLGDYITAPPGNPMLAPESDKRPALVHFDALDVGNLLD